MQQRSGGSPVQMVRQWLGRTAVPMLIGGQFRPAGSGGMRAVEDPATAARLALVPECTGEEAEEAFSRAIRARVGGAYPNLAPMERALLLHRLGDRLEADGDFLATVLTLDSGKPLRESREEVRLAADLLRLGAASAAHRQGVVHAEGRLRTWTFPEAVGTVVVLGASGLPLLSVVEPLGNALAAGNAVIVKPSELAPLAALRLAEHVLAAGLPEGVVQVLTGAGGTFGRALCSDPRADLVALSGSLQAGRAIREALAPAAREPVLNVGQAVPSVVLRDADLDAAADRVVLAACLGQGATGWAAHRLIVEEAIHDHLLLRIATRLSRIVVGNGLDPETEMGPLASAAHRASVEGLLHRARGQGAVLVLGGDRPPAAPLAQGYFLQAALLVGCSPDMEIAHAVPCAPLITVESVPDRDRAVESANRDARLALALGFSGSDDGARFLGESLGALQVWINHSGWPPLSFFHRGSVPRTPYDRARRVVVSRELEPSGWYRGN